MAGRQKIVLNTDDRRLVRRLLAGDDAAFRQFFDDHHARLYRFVITRIADDRSAAEEVVQLTMTKALRQIASWRGEAQLFTWLCAIARREIADWFRRRGREQRHVVLIEDEPGVRAAIESLPAARESEPDEQLRRGETRRLVQVALDQLPARYGDALEWKYIEGRSTREIADRLAIGSEAAQSLLARARRAFAPVYRSLVDGLDSAETS